MKVELVEATNDPERVICEAARNDYNPDWQGDMSFEEIMDDVEGDDLFEKKETLIGHLLDHGHFGPLEHVNATFRVKGVSRSCMAQITRHRHASFDIQSMRYVEFELEEGDEMQELFVEIPELDDPGICGRNGEFDEMCDDMTDEEILLERLDTYWSAMTDAKSSYDKLLKLGVAPENARMVLPIGTRVNMYFSMNLRQLLHVADMRASGDAQWEVREMTEDVLDLVGEWAPTVMAYYIENMHNRKNRLAP